MQAWMNNFTQNKMKDEITYQLLFPYFNGEAVISLGLDK